MAERKLYIGTSGWSYKHWKGIFYPDGLPARDYLSFYSRMFGATEINTSFYRLPKDKMIENWKTIKRGFYFCPKMSRFVTHMKKLNDPEQTLPRYFAVFEPIRRRLGPILIQLPASLSFNPDKVRHFFSVLKKDYRGYSFCLEARHPSWLEQPAIDLLTKFRVGWVIAESGPRWLSAELITARHIYLRFHGPDGSYASSYPDSVLREYARKCRQWLKDGYTVWAFFNNDGHGYAIQNALSLQQMLSH